MIVASFNPGSQSCFLHRRHYRAVYRAVIARDTPCSKISGQCCLKSCLESVPVERIPEVRPKHRELSVYTQSMARSQSSSPEQYGSSSLAFCVARGRS